jgi:hypothetical protein
MGLAEARALQVRRYPSGMGQLRPNSPGPTLEGPGQVLLY